MNVFSTGDYKGRFTLSASPTLSAGVYTMTGNFVGTIPGHYTVCSLYISVTASTATPTPTPTITPTNTITPSVTSSPNTTPTITPSPTTSSSVSYVTNGLQLYVDAGVTASYPGTGTTVYDISGNGAVLSLVNGVTYTPLSGKTFVYNGTNQYMSDYSGTTKFTGNSLTYTTIVKPTYKGNYMNYFEVYNAVKPMLWQTSAMKFELDTAAGYTSPLTYSGNTFMVTVTHSNTAGEGCKLYINGTYIGGNTSAQGAIPANPVFNFYRRPASPGYNYYGNAANIMLYNRVLTPTEITQNYNAFKTRFGI